MTDTPCVFVVSIVFQLNVHNSSAFNSENPKQLEQIVPSSLQARIMCCRFKI